MQRSCTMLMLCLFALLWQFGGGATSPADDNVGDAPATGLGHSAPQLEASRRANARQAATEKRRAWLREHLTAELHDKSEIARLNAQLDSLDHQQVDVAAARLLEQLDKRESRERATSRLARASAARDALPRVGKARHATLVPSPIGFFPVITVLPAGASLTASAVVSPDGRHVRVNVNPFFSSIGPVDTFNFYTGETHRLPAYHPHYRPGYHPYHRPGYHPHHQPEYRPHHRGSRPVTPWYDGLRTRNDRVPRR